MKLIHHEKQIILILAYLIIILPLSALAQNKQKLETNAKVIKWANWNCFTLRYPKAKLQRVVQAALEQADSGAAIWGDRSFAYDLNGDHQPEYIIPLKCGGVGNCDWGIFALNPSRLLGIVNGENIYIRRRVAQWSALTVYIHNSCCDGFLDTYIFRKGKYVKLPGEYYVTASYPYGLQGSKAHPLPKFMKTIPSPCGSRKINPAA